MIVSKTKDWYASEPIDEKRQFSSIQSKNNSMIVDLNLPENKILAPPKAPNSMI
jgi:hypothetical protein